MVGTRDDVFELSDMFTWGLFFQLADNTNITNSDKNKKTNHIIRKDQYLLDTCHRHVYDDNYMNIVFVQNRGKYNNRYIIPNKNVTAILSGQHKRPGRYQSLQLIKRTYFICIRQNILEGQWMVFLNISFKVDWKSKQQTHRHFT